MLVRLFAIPTALFALALFATTSSAQYQDGPIPGGYGSNPVCPSAQRFNAQRFNAQRFNAQRNIDRYQTYRPDIHHERFVAHRPDVDKLDQWADKLAVAAKHLHEDAHQLGQDYEHSQGIEAYVSKLDQLNEHMHEILHRAADRRHLSTYEIRHVSNDVLEVRRLAIRLDRELEHQRYDGARTQDFQALDHMRQILAGELFPLVRNMEFELDDRSTAGHGPIDLHRSHRVGYYGH